MLAGNLPDELMHEILTRVPPKPLVRFTAVSKVWYCLIKSPSFIKTHLKKSLADDSNGGYLLCMPSSYNQNKFCTLVCGSTLDELKRSELVSESDILYCTIVGSVNGLICLVDSCSVWLCNLAKHIGEGSSLGWCFPDCPYVVLGFGYHCQTDDHKVVRIMNVAESDRGKIPCEVEVYSLKEGGWRKVGDEFQWTILKQLPAALVNGNLHWIASSPKPEIDELVLSFDLREEVFREIMLPDLRVGELCLSGSLCVLKESLSLFVNCKDTGVERGEKCYLWVMKEYGVSNSWSKQYTFNTGGTIERLLGMTRFNEFLFETIYQEMISYDLENQETKCSDAAFDGPSSFDAVPLIESLLFLEGGDGVLGLESSFEGTNFEGTSTSFKEEEDS